jgi:hypothetical protein
MRAKGIRRIELSVPDARSPEFLAEAHRQALAIANSPHEPDDQAFIDSISIWPDDQD